MIALFGDQNGLRDGNGVLRLHGQLVYEVRHVDYHAILFIVNYLCHVVVQGNWKNDHKHGQF